MISNVTSIDHSLFHSVNAVWTNPLLDQAMIALSVAGNFGAVWFALLAAMAVFGGKAGRKMALAGFAAFAIGFASSELVKELTLRPRPLPALDHVRLLVAEPVTYAFPSGHATDAFAATSGVALAARRLLGRVPPSGWAMLALAAAISYSRVYVGVHWPTDVVAGAILGLGSGWAGARLALRRRPAGDAREAGGTPEEEREVEYVVER